MLGRALAFVSSQEARFGSLCSVGCWVFLFFDHHKKSNYLISLYQLTSRMNCFLYRVLLATLLATTMAAQTITSLPKVYTYSNATAFKPEGSPFVTFMFDLPMYEGLDDEGGSTPLWGEMGMEKGSCNMELDTGLIVCNIIQVFSDGQIMLQGTGNAAVEMHLACHSGRNRHLRWSFRICQ